jgi:mycothiol S-conjugate amidase
MSVSEIGISNAAEPLRLLAVHAHPDDESSKGAATTALYVAQGIEVLVATCTGGERGDILNPAFELGQRNLSDVRREEMQNAAEILGVAHQWLGFIDSGFPDSEKQEPLPDDCFAAQPIEVAAAGLVELVRSFRPHVITTYDENGGYPHPDHIRTHEVSMYAFEKAADPDYPSALPVWSVAKLYYHHTFTHKRVLALHHACLEAGMVSPYVDWISGWDETQDKWPRVTTRVPTADFFEVRDAALLAHATQIDPNGMWFGVPLEIQKSVWPTEDYELAACRLDLQLGDIMEDDLFFGLRS